MIVDQYGNAVNTSRHFNRGANQWRGDRPWVPTQLGDIGDMIPPRDRLTMVAVSRLLAENWGPWRGILRQMPMYSVGKAWKPSMQTDDQDVQAEAEMVIRERFCPLAGLDGKDFSTKLYELTLAMLRDGDGFYLLTEWETGFPAIQIIPCHRVGQRRSGKDFSVVESGPYKGMRIEDGIIFNKYGTTVAYRVLGDTEDEDMEISARSMGHVFDSDYSEGRRGYPVLAHALNDGRDGLQAHEWERLNMLARSAHTLIEHNETGEQDDDANNHFSNAPANSDGSGVMTGSILGGTYKTVRAGSGYKLESVKHDTPGDVWESFNNRIEKKIYEGVPWPRSFGGEKGEKGGGTAERRDIMLARQTIEDLQCTLDRHARRMIGYAYQKLVKLDRVPESADWWRWTFSKPPKITIDDGRVSKSMLEMWRAGVVSDEDLLTDMGKDHDDFYRNKFAKAADKELMFREAQEAKNVELDPRVKGMFTPNDTGEETNSKEDHED
jgi:hypothetical protein